jgi:hypothetical protein
MNALSVMSTRNPFCGPMTTQPVENRETVPTETQPMMPMVGRQRTAVQKKQTGKTEPGKTEPCNTEPCKSELLRAEIAQKSRRNSLRKQRDAQKVNPLLK